MFLNQEEAMLAVIHTCFTCRVLAYDSTGNIVGFVFLSVHGDHSPTCPGGAVFEGVPKGGLGS